MVSGQLAREAELQSKKKATRIVHEWQISGSADMAQAAFAFAFFFRSAQRSFIISEIRLRAAALMVRRFRLWNLNLAVFQDRGLTCRFPPELE